MHVFDVLSDPVRRRILELLGRGEMASGEVVEAIGAEFGITQAAVSQHLKVLRESGFARVRAEAQRRLYSVDAAGLQAVDPRRIAKPASRPVPPLVRRAASVCPARSPLPARPTSAPRNS
jgi:DNA-binding transcriptional ArsR family regulator